MNQVKFCYCGRVLKPGAIDFCNEKCRARKERDDRPKVKKKYGVAGYIYSDSGSKKKYSEGG